MVYIETQVDELVECFDLSVGDDFVHRVPEVGVRDIDFAADLVVWEGEGRGVDGDGVMTTREDVADDAFGGDVCVVERVVGCETQVKFLDFGGAQSVGPAHKGDGTHRAIGVVAVLNK